MSDMQKYMDEFIELEQEVFNQNARDLFAQDDNLVDLVKISVMCKVLYMKVRMVRDEYPDQE